MARQAVEIAAAGGHHLLLVGPPGSGKSILARSLVDLLPDLDPAQARRPLTVGELLTVRRAIDRAPTGPDAALAALFTINTLLNPFWTPPPNHIPPSAVTIPARQLHRIRTWAGRSYHNPVLRLHAVLDIWVQHGPADYQD